MNGRELCAWLNGFEGLSADLLRELDPGLNEKEIIETLREQDKITEHCAERLKNLSNDGWGRRQLELAEESGVSVTTWYDEDYPPRLRDIDEPPLLLYVKGRLPDFERSCSVVGTRRCTAYGMKVSEMLGAGLARAENIVVSGGARGIDGGAHGGALSVSGVTVAVLGTGIDVVWPPEHDELFANIVKDGALISEYPFGTTGRSWRFPRRNRIIAGISGKLIVVESPMKGGAMITARKAMEMGREVWAVPGRIDERVCEGSNRLILDGASPLVSIEDFVDHISTFGQLELFSPVNITPDEKKVLDCLRDQGDLTLDQLSARTGLTVVQLMQCTAELQLQSLIYPTGGGRWRAVPK